MPRTVLTLLNAKGKFVQELELELDAVHSPEVIRSLGRYYRKDVGVQAFPVYRETTFFWAHQAEYRPYILLPLHTMDDGRGTEAGTMDEIDSFKTFKEAEAAGRGLKKVGVGSFQIMDIRNTRRFYTDGKGWSDGRK